MRAPVVVVVGRFGGENRGVGSGGGGGLGSSLAPTVGGRRWAVGRLEGGDVGCLEEEEE